MIKAKNAILMIQLNSFWAPSCMKIKSDCRLYSFNGFYLNIFLSAKKFEERESGSFVACHGLAHRTSPQTKSGLTSEFGRDQVCPDFYGRHQDVRFSRLVLSITLRQLFSFRPSLREERTYIIIPSPIFFQESLVEIVSITLENRWSHTSNIQT